MAESRQQRRAREREEAKAARRPEGPSQARVNAERRVRATLGDHAHAHGSAGWSWCPAPFVEHQDGTEECELGAECLVGGVSAPHDEGGDCPGPIGGCEHCQQAIPRCEAQVIEHEDGYRCVEGHDDSEEGRWHPSPSVMCDGTCPRGCVH